MKLLCVFNVCGLRGLEHVDLYVKYIESLLEQDFDDYRVVVSGACSTGTCKRVLKWKFGNRVSYNWTNTKLTVAITFNQTVQRMEQEFGPFDGHVYLDSGVDVRPHPDLLRKMHNRILFTYPYGITCAMVSARPDTDSGFEFAGLPSGSTGEYLVPVGKAFNLHCTCFHRSIYEAYGNRIVPDIFVGDTTESTFSFLCAAVNRRWLLLGTPEVHHEHSMDGPSSGHERGGWNDPGKLFLYGNASEHLVRIHNGRKHGMGYEECQPHQPWALMHDPSRFNEDGSAKDPAGLRDFIRDNLYLRSEMFDYTKLGSVFQP